MDLNRIIRELLDERDKLDRIVASLEELKLDGRSPGSSVSTDARRGRKSMDLHARQEVSRRMKKYWEEQRKKKATS